MGIETDDLLDMLIKKMQLHYLSDLRKPELRKLLMEMLGTIPEDVYSLREWNDAVCYLFSGSSELDSVQAAKQHLLQRLKASM